MKLQKDFIVISPDEKIIHRISVTDKYVYDRVDIDLTLDVLYNRSTCTVITEIEYHETISHLKSIIYGKFADPETPIEDLVNSFKYIHNIFLNEPCED